MNALRMLVLVAVLSALGCQGIFEDLSEVEFDAGSTDEAARLELSVSQEPPEVVVAGDVFTVGVLVERPTNEGGSVGGLMMNLSLNTGSFADGEDELTAMTNADGVAQFQARLETARQGVELTAAVEDDEGWVETVTQSFDVVAAAAAEGGSSITAWGTTVADGVDEAEITIVLGDEFGNALVGVEPTFEASGGGNTYGSCPASDEQGESRCTMSSTTAGSKVLAITSPLDMVGGTANFVVPCDPGAVDEFGGGDGTPENPFQICSAHHLELVGGEDTDRSASFLLTGDLDLVLVTEFTMIGDDESPFDGHFDGGGFTIRNLQIDDEETDGVGLFRVVGEGGEIDGVHLRDVDVVGGSTVGTLAAVNHGVIRGSSASGQVQGEVTVGGLVAENFGEIDDSFADVEVTGTSVFVPLGGPEWSRIGGLVGRNAGDISRSYALGPVTGQNVVGGVVGYHDAGLIEETYTSANVSGQQRVGGFVGWVNSGGDVRESYSTGQVAGGEYTGGFVGDGLGTIYLSYSSGRVTPGGENRIGGFGGRTFAAVNECIWDQESSEMSEGAGVWSGSGITGLVTAGFGDEGSFSPLWDFESVWEMRMAPDGEVRPVLQWQEE